MTKLLVVAFAHDSDPGQTLLAVTDITSGAAWTPLGRAQGGSGLDLAVYARTYVVNELAGVRFTFSNVRRYEGSSHPSIPIPS